MPINQTPSTITANAEQDVALWFYELVTQVTTIVEQSGEVAGFDARQWVTHWINTPVPALGGKYPLELSHSMEGRALVTSLLAKMQSGVYA